MQFETKQTKLFGLEKVYKEYQLYKTLLSNSNRATVLSTVLLQSGYVGPGMGMGGGFADNAAIKHQRDEVTQSLETYGLKGGISEFEQVIDAYATGFESEAVELANNLLDCYNSMLVEARNRYANETVANALFDQLTDARKHYQKVGESRGYFRGFGGARLTHSQVSALAKMAEQMRQEQALGRQGVEALSASHPLFQDGHLPESKRLDQEKLALAKNGKELQTLLSKYINERQSDIAATRKHLKDQPTTVVLSSLKIY